MSARYSYLLLSFAVVLAAVTATAQTVITSATYGSGQTTTVSDPSTIQAGTAVDVQSGASITYFAGTKISLEPGFHAESGSYFHALLSLSGPSNLVLSSVSGTASVISWSAASGGAGVSRYDIYRNGVLVGSVTAGQPLTFSDTSLSDDSTYMYSVVAVDASGSHAATALSVKTPPVLEVFSPTS